ncbi:MAG: hypothetical protein ABSD46_01520, partial [Bacteroidota bacterium]
MVIIEESKARYHNYRASERIHIRGYFFDKKYNLICQQSQQEIHCISDDCRLYLLILKLQVFCFDQEIGACSIMAVLSDIREKSPKFIIA